MYSREERTKAIELYIKYDRCAADVACEGFFGRLKNEMFHNRSWMGVSIEEFIDILHEYLVWYNEKRIRLSLGAMSPLEYRRDLGLAA
jgi:putative transposase